MAIRFANGFGIGAANNGGGGGSGPQINCNPTALKMGTLYYNSGTTLNWSDDTSGYTFYNGGYNAIDDGYATNPVTLPTYFYMNCTGSTKIYISTNGGVSFETGTSGPYPANNNNTLIIGGSPGDLWLQDGLGLSDGTNQGAWYKITNTSDFMKVELKVFQGRYQATSTPYSYQMNLYKDSTYQWVEVMSKDNFDGNNCGPSSSTNVSQPNSTISKVWRSGLGGNDWQYMGEGSVDTVMPCNANFTVSNCGTSHVYNAEPYTEWNGYGANYLQVGPSVDGGGTIPPQAGWYFVDNCGTVRQLTNNVLWMSGGNPSPYPNGTGWLCEANGSFVLSVNNTTLTFCESMPIVTFN